MNTEQIVDKIVKLNNEDKLHWQYKRDHYSFGAAMFKTNVDNELFIILEKHTASTEIGSLVKMWIYSDNISNKITILSDKITELFNHLNNVRCNEENYKKTKEKEILLKKIDAILA